VNASVTKISVILLWILGYAIRKISFSSLHEHSWGKVGGGRRRKYIHYTNYKQEVVSEYTASMGGVIHCDTFYHTRVL
jgi:hypothetical protein